jgi:hypothetical protein
MQGHTVAKILHPWQCWERPVILFQAMWCVLIAEVWLGCDIIFSFFFFYALEIRTGPSKKKIVSSNL